VGEYGAAPFIDVAMLLPEIGKPAAMISIIATVRTW